tara:strand:+ start:33 stop:260 length:228 start_codon:yes stop_codon:yes gene_type:complete
MINELLNMNGHGIYVLPAFSFTLLSFAVLYFVTKAQYVKEQKNFVAKYGLLSSEKAICAKSQRINKEILANATNN